MPGLNGTGPMGQGPATGRGFGYCVNEYPVFAGRGGGRGMGRGRGMGFGRGFGGGFGRFRGNYGFYPAAYGSQAYQPSITPESEVTYLKNQAAYLEQQIKEIHTRISELGKEETPES